LLDCIPFAPAQSIHTPSFPRPHCCVRAYGCEPPPQDATPRSACVLLQDAEIITLSRSMRGAVHTVGRAYDVELAAAERAFLRG
jgi:hypothetical protein